MSVEHIRPQDTIRPKQPPDILLINVPATFQQGIIPDDEEPPFGLIRIAEVCDIHGFKPALLDTHRSKLTVSEIDDVLYGIKPKLVGVNPTSVNIPEAQKIAELCTQRGIPLIVGGVHATLETFVCLKKDFPMSRAVVKGKGENATLHILTDVASGGQTEQKGVYYQDTNIDRTDFAQYYPLASLPPTNLWRWIENPLIKRRINFREKEVDLNEVSLYETAGCPFQCSFCASPLLVGRGGGYKPYHRSSMDRILASTKLSIELGVNAIHFMDDMAFIKPEQFRQFATGVERLNLKEPFYWRGMTRAPIISERCSDEDLTILAQSGCWKIAMGVESGDEQILRRIKKEVTLQQVRNAVDRLKKAGVPQVKGFFIMGFPDETFKQIMSTRRFIMELKQLGLTDIGLFQFKPYPGTEEWQRLEQTNPDVLKNLSYLRNDSSNNSNIVSKRLAVDAVLPDDLRIAEIPSGVVKEIILETLKKFYDN
ncbi:MAG: B12-binding domain-containing radical SAM protein [Patescibacteria group bacterium]